MRKEKLIDSLFAMYLQSPDRLSSAILGHKMSGDKVEKRLSLKIHNNIYNEVQKMADLTGLSEDDFIIDCIAYGFLEIGRMLGEIEEVTQIATHEPPGYPLDN